MKYKRQEGAALIFALFTVLMIAGAAAVVAINLKNSKTATDSAVDQVLADEACLAGIDMAIEMVWGRYMAETGQTAGNLNSYRDFLDGIVRTNEDINRNGMLDEGEQDSNGNGTFDSAPPVHLISAGSPLTLKSGTAINSLAVDRTDDVTGCLLTIECTAKSRNVARTITQTTRISGERFTGFQFAVLANNINCILCHAQFLNLDLHQNTEPELYGNFGRIRIASLESLLIRKTEADSYVAGAVYSRGQIYNKDGSLLGAAQIAASDFHGYAFDSSHGKITQDSRGNMSKCALANTALDENGKPSKYGNLYLNYPTEDADMTDGLLPKSFPAAFTDDNNDRAVNDDEFSKYVNSADGSVTGGIAYGVPEGSTYTAASLPASSDSTTLTQLAKGSYDGNLILVGTADNPIVIDNKVAVDGDLVIKGMVKGAGQLLVKGNVYVMGDVTYADAAGKFGQASDGAANAFAINAGGNIMMGDYLTIRAKNNYTTKKVGNKYEDRVDTGVWQGQFIQVDTAAKNIKMSTEQTTSVGYFDAGAVDAGAAQGASYTSTYTANGKQHTWYHEPEGQFSFTTSELMLFNRMERQKWAPPGHADYNADYYIPGYVPRYYQLRDGAPLYQYVASKVTDPNLLEHSVNYLSPGVEVIPLNDLGNATILSLNPKSNWISEHSLRHMWFDDETYRRANPDADGRAPWRFDGLLYTSNCIFGVTRGNARHKSATYGAMHIRGAIVCADLGMLVCDNGHESPTDPLYSGLRLYYDKRVDAFLNVEDPAQVTFARIAYRHKY